jgi:hypothetical protein
MARGGIGWLSRTFRVYAGKCLEFKRVDLQGYLGQIKGKKLSKVAILVMWLFLDNSLYLSFWLLS